MKRVLRLIDYNFQRREQLTEAYDDSNSMRYISKFFDIRILGRLNIQEPESHVVEDNGGNKYTVTFLPSRWMPQDVMTHIKTFNPDVVHLHGTSAWPQYFVYSEVLRSELPNAKFIFSPAGGCKGPPDFLNRFDKVIVNHPMQIERMRCDHDKVIVRKRSADPSVFHYVPGETGVEFDFVYVAAFIPLKKIDLMIDFVSKTPFSLVVLGDFNRVYEHYQFVKRLIRKRNLANQILLHDFLPQKKVAEFLGKCRIWVWPNIPPENAGTTTNRSVIEAIACGMPLLIGEQAFNQTEYLINGYNGYKYKNPEDFEEKARRIMTSPKTYRNNSAKLFGDHFNFIEHFIEFYIELYNS